MRISTRSTYGIRALLHLATRYGEGPVAIGHMVQGEGLPRRYMEQLLHRLRREGLVRSVRGRNGGYVLAREPGRITLADALRALDGTIAPVSCVDRFRQPQCDRMEGCAAREMWKDVTQRIEQVLESVTLAGLSERETQSPKKR